MSGAACLYCSGDRHVPLWRRVRDRLRYVPGFREFWRCAQCGSAMLVPFPDRADISSFYPPTYNVFIPTSHQGPLLSKVFNPLYRLQIQRMVETMHRRHQTGGRLLDVGCGSGWRLREFQRLGYEVVATDVQREVVDYVRRRLAVWAVCADASELTQHFSPASFDVITAFHVVEHLPDVREALQGCFQLLKPGGWFVGGAPLADSMQARAFRARWVATSEAPRHVSLPSQEGLERACRYAGFTDVVVKPDALMHCVGAFVRSAVPGASMEFFARSSLWYKIGQLLLGGASCVVAIPWCVVENVIVRRPAFGLVFAQKPVAVPAAN